MPAVPSGSFIDVPPPAELPDEVGGGAGGHIQRLHAGDVAGVALPKFKRQHVRTKWVFNRRPRLQALEAEVHPLYSVAAGNYKLRMRAEREWLAQFRLHMQ